MGASNQRFERRLEVKVDDARLLVLSFVSLTLAIVAALSGYSLIYAGLLAALTFLLFTITVIVDVTGHLRPRDVTADVTGLRLDGALTPAQRISGALVIPKPEGNRQTRFFVRLFRRGLRVPIDIMVSDAGEGRELLRALGLGAAQRSMTFRTASLLEAYRGYPFLSAIACAIPLVSWLASSRAALASAFAGASLVLVLGLLFWPGKLDVGGDGLSFRWLFYRWFIRYEDILNVEIYEFSTGKRPQRGVGITLKSGKFIRIPIFEVFLFGDVGASQGSTEPIAERIREAMESYQAGGASGTEMLARRGRDLGAWVRSLQSIGSGANVGPRTAPIARERLVRIVEDPSLTHVDRVAAAVALSSDEDGRTCIASASRATVEPMLRVALERAATGEEEALIEALAEAETETAARS